MFTNAKSILTNRSLPKRTLGALSIAFALTGCISANAGSDGRYTTPIGDAPVINNETPYSNALRCIATHVDTGAQTMRIAVGNIRDYTGKEEADGSGRKITQGASLMAMSALGKAGVPLVERYDTSVTELELKYANNKLIGDAQPDGDYRKIFAGEIRGSDYYLVGGITELNFNIRSGGVSASVASQSATGWGASAAGNVYVMNIGLDLRLVNSRTLEVVDFVSYQKQIVGHEVKAGVFDFLGGNLFDVGAGESAQEPIQLAVRAVIERAVLKMLVPLYHVNPSDCVRFAGNGDPMGAIDYRQTHPEAASMPAPADGPRTADAPAAPAARPASQKVAADPAPYAYYSDVDNSGLRGNVN
ncbi:MAG: holdfast anchoring protein HfaB [Parvibaculum sp.]|uniref:holdfast anchoring protein HfaB n=1 Tax=Parvibaculum sp. TaxID=2024848 RepID=UPI002845B7A5|nr:holdfast anchoring protein HfaB [Parvibaculum sp.]MDR3499250.1 holdfast anchoring protein HfaB [Parvibaculum sp.]